MVKIYKNQNSGGNGEFVIWTDESDANDSAFIENLGNAILQCLEKYDGDDNWTIEQILRSLFPLYLKMCGYKADSVKETKAYISGHSMPDECTLAGVYGK